MLRASAATHLFDAGVAEREIQLLLGHGHPATTVGYARGQRAHDVSPTHILAHRVDDEAAEDQAAHPHATRDQTHERAGSGDAA